MRSRVRLRVRLARSVQVWEVSVPLCLSVLEAAELTMRLLGSRSVLPVLEDQQPLFMVLDGPEAGRLLDCKENMGRLVRAGTLCDGVLVALL